MICGKILADPDEISMDIPDDNSASGQRKSREFSGRHSVSAAGVVPAAFSLSTCSACGCLFAPATPCTSKVLTIPVED